MKEKNSFIKNITNVILFIIAIVLFATIIVLVNNKNVKENTNNNKSNLPTENEVIIEEKELEYGVTLDKGVCFIQLKVVSEDGDLLRGEYFELYELDTEKFICQFATNENGIAVVRGLDYGNYEICDVASPKGYVASKAYYKIELSEEKIYDATEYVKIKEENIVDKENDPVHSLYDMEIE